MYHSIDSVLEGPILVLSFIIFFSVLHFILFFDAKRRVREIRTHFKDSIILLNINK